MPKISPGAYIFQRSFLRGLYSEGLIYGGKFAFQNDWGSFIVGMKFTIFALFYSVFDGNFQVQTPPPPPSEGLIHGRAYFTGLFYGMRY